MPGARELLRAGLHASGDVRGGDLRTPGVDHLEAVLARVGAVEVRDEIGEGLPVVLFEGAPGAGREFVYHDVGVLLEAALRVRVGGGQVSAQGPADGGRV